MKKAMFFILVVVFFPFFVHASDDGVYPIRDEETLDKCLTLSSVCRLQSDVSVTSQKVISGDVTIDLNGKMIQPDSSMELHGGLFVVERGGHLVITDSKGSGKITSGTDGRVWAAVQLVKTSSSSEGASLEVNGGTLEGYYYGIVGNGKRDNTKVILRDGTVTCNHTEDCTAIFQPQAGDLTIYNGTIRGGTGIEIRSGTLTIYDGTIEGVDSNFSKMANENGTTTEGVGVAVAQHTTKQAIQVFIHGGVIRGQYAFYEWNPQKNGKEDLDKIHIQIDGGDFEGLANGVPAVFSEDFTAFISGGNFNTSVDDYLTGDANVFFEVNENSSSSGFSLFWIFIPCILGLFGGLWFVKFKKSVIPSLKF